LTPASGLAKLKCAAKMVPCSMLVKIGETMLVLSVSETS